MATFTVTTTADVVDAGDGALSLREAVARANATGAADTIGFAAAVDGRTLTLTGGQLELRANATIDGDRNDDGEGVTISGGDASRVLLVAGAGTDVALQGARVADGNTSEEFVAASDGAGIRVEAGAGLTLAASTVTGNLGGGIFAGEDSRVTVTRSTISENVAADSGAGINAGPGSEVAIVGSRITGNVGYDGGGIFLVDASLEVARSRIDGNSAQSLYRSQGGGILAQGSRVEIVQSTIAGNTGGESGGGIDLQGGHLVVAASTLSGNRATGGSEGGVGAGGAISAQYGGSVELSNVTVTGNRAASGYTQYFGIAGVAIGPETDVGVANSIIAGNIGTAEGAAEAATDVRGALALSNGHNIFGSEVEGAVAGDLEGVAVARLFAEIDPATGTGRLAFNGGPTPTVALRDALGNPALSGGELVAAGEVDQRGFGRPLPGKTNPDVGAFELDQDSISTDPTGGNDVVAGTAGADSLAGRAGADLLRGLGGNDVLDGGAGGDTLQGGPGGDVLRGGAGQDTATYRELTGPVTASLTSGSAAGGSGADQLTSIENLQGGAAGDGLEGDAGTNWLGGGAGSDRLGGRGGADALAGGAGADTLRGDGGRDLQAGGAGADRFDFDRVSDSPWTSAGNAADLVLDFGGDDRLDLSTIDARTGAAGNQQFTLLASEGAAFTGAGQVRFLQEGGDTLVEANVDADRTAELQVRLAGLEELAATDFVL